MAGSIKGTKTEQNLLKAFAGESQARNRYTFFASEAQKEGFEQIAAIFEETADNEKEHAKVFFKHLEGGDLEITATYPAGAIGTTATTCSPRPRARRWSGAPCTPTSRRSRARKGFPEVATSLRARSRRSRHSTRCATASCSRTSTRARSSSRRAAVKWHCLNCGYIAEGASRRRSAPPASIPQAYYEVLAENW